MKAKDAIKTAISGANDIMNMYLADLSDADILVRPVPGANCIAWQLGHLIQTEAMVAAEVGGAKVELPAGFDKQHDGATAKADPPKGFSKKADYLALFAKARGAVLAALEKLTDADLDKASTGPLAKFAPTWGALILLLGNHQLMHAGQFTVVRRKLGKPVLF